MNTAIIIPAYNEALTIEATIRDFYNVFPSAEIYVINNRSTDETEEIARNTFAYLGCKGGILNESRPGKANAIRRAFLTVDAQVYVMVDADTTYPANQVFDLCAPIVSGEADMVIGDRLSGGHYKSENKRPMHMFGNILVKKIVNTAFKSNLSDIMSGYRAFSRSFVKTYPILVEGFDIETDMTIHALDKRFKICEIPVNYKDRPEGSFSKLNTIKDGVLVLSTFSNVLRYYRPLAFFASMGLLFSILGLVAGIPVLNDWFQYQYIYRVPLAILASALEIISLILFAIGLILDSLVQKSKIDFENNLIRMYSSQKNGN